MNYLEFVRLAGMVSIAVLLSACEPDERLADDGSVNACLAGNMLVSGIAGSINGNGLFVLSDGGNISYSRNGEVCVDQEGWVLHPSGHHYQVYLPPNNTLGESDMPPTTHAYVPPANIDTAMPLESVYVGETGTLFALYADDTIVELDTIMLATFNNPHGLEKLSSDRCRETLASGISSYSVPGKRGLGIISAQAASHDEKQCEASSPLFGQLLSVDGEGLLQLTRNGKRAYSDNLELRTDNQGYLFDANDYQLSAYDAFFNLSPSQLPINLNSPSATESIHLSVNLSAGETPYDAQTIPFVPTDPSTYHSAKIFSLFDSLGIVHSGIIYFRKIKPTASNLWSAYFYVDELEVIPSGQASASPAILQFSTDGTLLSAMPNGELGSITNIEYLPLSIPGAADLQLNIDMANSTQYGAPFSISHMQGDGYPAGYLVDIDISPEGEVSGQFQSELPPYALEQSYPDFQAPLGTTLVDIEVNLNASETLFSPETTPFVATDPSTYHSAADLTIYDSLGGEHNQTIYFRKVNPSSSNLWEIYNYIDGIEVIPLSGQISGTPALITFDTSGQLMSAYPTSDQPQFGIIYQYFSVAGAQDLNVVINVSNSTQYTGTFTVNKLTQDGHPALQYAEGEVPPELAPLPRQYFYHAPLFQLPLATFSNKEALEYLNNGLYRETAESGPVQIGLPNSEGYGELQWLPLSE